MRRARRAETTGAPMDPIVWARALGINVEDVDGNVFVDLTSGFGVASLGHRHPAVTRAIHEQTDRLLHALGDVHPSEPKIALMERLASLGPWPETRV
ncbi:MAG: aminotransferase class III-fold pyridoxal phosphate-dependent enzyme, partial [Myxococcales bacterium]|nr:aminotransferase class III-fold pyridoxal phosphate-dependent enzyme [Myxococcales bacterium]